jgi:hypothetical protein
MTLATDLAHFTGTENYYRAINRAVTYTDGAKYFADKAGAHWLIDIISTELPGHANREGFLHIKMTVADSKAAIAADDGNGKIVWTRDIDWTDCPEGEWRFYMAPGGPEGTTVIMLPQEY